MREPSVNQTMNVQSESVLSLIRQERWGGVGIIIAPSLHQINNLGFPDTVPMGSHQHLSYTGPAIHLFDHINQITEFRSVSHVSFWHGFKSSGCFSEALSGQGQLGNGNPGLVVKME